MIKSKAWDWKQLNEETQKEIWLEPSIESYYLINRWKKQNKESFLDIGCGLGRHSIQFAKNEFCVTAVDLSAEALRQAKEWASEENLNIEFLNKDMLELPFKDNSFDCILCRNVIAHTDTEGIKIIVNKIHSLLKENGECFLTLGSKNASTYKDPKNISVDENTKLRMDEGPEKGVPHFYADMDIIPKLFKDFKIEYLAQTQEFKENADGSFRSYWHYFLLIKKK
ncbi:MAG: class I SAM-dependent methyltransferase [Clostridia bacterium]